MGLLSTGLAALACRSAPVTIRAGLLLDGRGGQSRDVVITVARSTITAIGPYTGQEVTWDLSRATVLPGLIDAHVHISGFFTKQGRTSTGRESEPEQRAAQSANARATLLAGFTTVASMGSPVDKWLRDAIARGSIPGPRVLTSMLPFGRTRLSPAELRREVRGRRRDGADFIKIFDSELARRGGGPTLSPAQLMALCSEAHAQGLRAVVHAQSDASMRDAVQAGCDEVEHGSLSTPAGLAVLAGTSVWFDPQCRLVLSNYLDNRSRFEGIGTLDSAGFAFMEQLLPILPRVIRNARGIAGIHEVYGTDAVAGGHGRNAEDLICRVRDAGQTPMEVLVLATSGTAAGLGLGDRVGTIAPGFLADLIALDGNPLDSIEVVRKVSFVMKEGRVFKH